MVYDLTQSLNNFYSDLGKGLIKLLSNYQNRPNLRLKCWFFGRQLKYSKFLQNFWFSFKNSQTPSKAFIPSWRAKFLHDEGIPSSVATLYLGVYTSYSLRNWINKSKLDTISNCHFMTNNHNFFWLKIQS